MTKIEKLTTRMLLAFASTAAVLLASACAATPVQDEATAREAGARVWRTTCNRCHNARSVPEFTAAQWPVIVKHMRARAHLTRSEAQAVTAYLQGLAEGE